MTERDLPMDRLICGDVGFGKTEVALRAILIAVIAGKQVMVLTPSTVLAKQHFETIRDRFAGFLGIKVALLCRFQVGDWVFHGFGLMYGSQVFRVSHLREYCLEEDQSVVGGSFV